MGKYWKIYGNQFFSREAAKEFLAMTWAKDPEKSLCNEDIMYYFNEYDLVQIIHIGDSMEQIKQMTNDIKGKQAAYRKQEEERRLSRV